VRRIWLSAVAICFSATGCTDFVDDPAVKVCEAIAKSSLVAPTTYQRVSYSMDENIVSIVFDANNSFNTPMRNTLDCVFEKMGSSFVLQDRATKAVSAEIADFKKRTEGNAYATTKEYRAEFAAMDERLKNALADRYVRERLVAAASKYPIPVASTSLHDPSS
jgi:hypothetical protein